VGPTCQSARERGKRGGPVIAVGPEAERAGLREMGRCGGKKKRDGWAVWA
jgi:hypothetical protein